MRHQTGVLVTVYQRSSEVRDRAVLWFATVQMIAVIYLQKIAMSNGSLPVSLPMIIMFASVAWMIRSQNLQFDSTRLIPYLVFVFWCLYSQSLSGGSIPSILELILLYGCLTLRANLSYSAYLQLFDRFVKLMVVPAGIILMQYVYQKATGLSNPLDMDRMLPRGLLLPGFTYEFHYPWYSTFMRPNGFFFLETSFASMFTAAASIVEIIYFRRRFYVGLMLISTALTMGGTGISMLAVVTPFLLLRESPRLVIALLLLIVAYLIIVYLYDLPLLLSSRLDEFNHTRSSGSNRLVEPIGDLMRMLFDPSYFFLGSGAGSSKGLTWPVVKLGSDYGLISVIPFMVFYISSVAKNKVNLPLTIGLSFIYFFTGGYLLSPILVELLFLLCFLAVPPSEVAL
jgi:hypothetical protein